MTLDIFVVRSAPLDLQVRKALGLLVQPGLQVPQVLAPPDLPVLLVPRVLVLMVLPARLALPAPQVKPEVLDLPGLQARRAQLVLALLDLLAQQDPPDLLVATVLRVRQVQPVPPALLVKLEELDLQDLLVLVLQALQDQPGQQGLLDPLVRVNL